MLKPKTLISIIILIPLLIISLNSCYSDYGLSTKDYDLVATFFDKNTDFQQFQTFTLLDTVVRVKDGGGTSSDFDTRYDQQILNRIADNLTDYGYSRIDQKDVDSTNKPSVFLLVSAVSSENYAYYPGYWWGYWGWYPGWGYYPGYGPGWGGYYPGGVAYSYTTGSLFITMLDADNIDVENKTATINWAVAINGLLDDSNTNISSRINETIDQSFQQSSYLKLN